ncbi:MAG: hypothetical protein WBW33_01705 [Bryobacteraceae bacterium]
MASTLVATFCFGQTTTPASSQQSDPAKPAESTQKRIFWIIPNYRTFPYPTNYTPIPPKEKFKIAADDAFDRGTVVLAAAFAGEGQLTNSNPYLGQGVKGYASYFGTAYADFVIGDFMTEAIYPTLLHQDPRYFRRGTGGGWSRLGYAVGQIFWTHTDSGGTQFNYSEILGNSTAVAISMAYYPDGRNVSTAVTELGTQIGVDMASNVLKEFWPDIRQKLSRKHAAPDAAKLGSSDNH